MDTMATRMETEILLVTSHADATKAVVKSDIIMTLEDS